MHSGESVAILRPASSSLEMDDSTRHLRFGWFALATYVTLGIGLELMHGFKIGWYLDVGNEVRRLMLTLGHFHGTMLALVNIAAGLTIRGVEGLEIKRSVSWALIWAAILLPSGFLLGGFFTYDGDPGSGVWLVPPGALLMLYGVIGFALECKNLRPDSGGRKKR